MKRLRGHKGDVCATTACRGRIASAGYDKTICVWDPSLPTAPGSDQGKLGEQHVCVMCAPAHSAAGLLVR